MFNKRLVGGALAITLTLAACGTDNADQAAEQTANLPEGQQAAPAAGAATPAALLGNTELGNMLVGSDGRTLYGFTNDTEAASTCYGGCAEAWPPVIVDQEWAVGPGVDLGIFATTTRDDGQLQLVAGKWPLYYYAGDAVPGDVNGQGSGDVWFAVATDGVLITDGAETAAAAPAESEDQESDDQSTVVGVGDSDLGQVLVDEAGLTLYGFTNDVDGVPTCEDGCAEAWPPLTVDDLPAGLDPALFSVAERPDGSMQLVAGVWPLYLFAGDGAVGDVNGQGSGGVWFAAAPDGSLIGASSGSDTGSDSETDSGEGY